MNNEVNNNQKVNEFFESMYNETYRLVYYIAYNFVFDEQTAEDLAHDSFESAFNNLDKLACKDYDNFKPWISTIVSNKSKDYLKKHKPMLFVDVSDNEQEIEFEDKSEDINPSVVAHKRELTIMIDSVMSELPERQRIIVFMYYFEDLSINEVAEATGMNANTVKSNLFYGRNKIKSSIEEKEKKGFVLYGLSPIFLFVFGLKDPDFFMYPSGDYSNFFATTQLSNTSNTKNPSTTQNLNPSNSYKLKRISITLIVFGSLITIYTFGIKPLLNNSEPLIADVTVLEDLFNYIDVSFEGENGNGHAIITKKEVQGDQSQIIKDLEFTIEDDGKLFNNEFVTITINDKGQFKHNIYRTLTKKYLINNLK